MRAPGPWRLLGVQEADDASLDVVTRETGIEKFWRDSKVRCARAGAVMMAC